MYTYLFSYMYVRIKPSFFLSFASAVSPNGKVLVKFKRIAALAGKLPAAAGGGKLPRSFRFTHSLARAIFQRSADGIRSGENAQRRARRHRTHSCGKRKSCWENEARSQ